MICLTYEEQLFVLDRRDQLLSGWPESVWEVLRSKQFQRSHRSTDVCQSLGAAFFSYIRILKALCFIPFPFPTTHSKQSNIKAHLQLLLTRFNFNHFNTTPQLQKSHCNIGPPDTMKSYLIILVSVLATTVLGTPIAEPEQPQTREVCYRPGTCGWFESGQCEKWCYDYGGFQYMQGCKWGRKRCCCVEPN